MTPGWPVSWIQALGSHSSPPLSMYVSPVIHMLRALAGAPSWGNNVLLRPSGHILDWTHLRPLHKLSRFWQVGAEIYRSCKHLRQASSVSSLVSLVCHLSICSGCLFLWSLLTDLVQDFPPGRLPSFQSKEDEFQCSWSKLVKYFTNLKTIERGSR